MSLQITPSPQEISPDVSQEHYDVAEEVARKYRNLQFDNRLNDDIDSAALFGITNAYNHYDVSKLTNGLIATCVKNAILNVLRCKANSGMLLYETEEVDRTRADAWQEVVSTDDIVDVKRQIERKRELLAKLLDTDLLNESQKQVITLMMSDKGYDQPEIARMLGVNQPAISKRYNKAIAKLREAVHGELSLAA